MITRIKEIEWYDAKAKKDAVTYKVWVERNSQTELHYFDSQTELAKFQQTFLPKIKKTKKNDTPSV